MEANGIYYGQRYDGSDYDSGIENYTEDGTYALTDAIDTHY